jgi:hypothetical protein
MFKKKSKLSKVERKYCSCLVKVRSRKIKNPYGICTNSVYSSRKIKRDKVVRCSKYYNFNELTKNQLYYLAKEKNLRVNKRLLKKELIDLLKTKLYKD